MIRPLTVAVMACFLAACTATGGNYSAANTKASKPARQITNQEIAAYVPRWVGKMDVRPSPRPKLPTADLLRGENAEFVKQIFGAPLREMNAGESGLWVYRTDLCTMHLFVKDDLVTEVILRPVDDVPAETDLLNRCFRAYLASRVDDNKLQ